MKQIPYGIADFYSLRTEDNLYVDRTDRIKVLERFGKALLFLRPRRFGKSLWLSTLATYYEPNYVTHSEPELDHRYADLCLLRRPAARTSSVWDLLFEFKRMPDRHGTTSMVLKDVIVG